MNRLTVLCIGMLAIQTAGCYKDPYVGQPPGYQGLGTGIFQEASGEAAEEFHAKHGPLTEDNVKLYMLQQQALLRARLAQHSLDFTLDDKNNLSFSLPGNQSFSINSAAINWNIHSILDATVTVLKMFDETGIEIIGHSDSRGNQEINQILSGQRANSIANYLIRSGINSSRIYSHGVGDEAPVAPNTTTLDRSLNRRVELIISPLFNFGPYLEPQQKKATGGEGTLEYKMGTSAGENKTLQTSPEESIEPALDEPMEVPLGEPMGFSYEEQ